MSLLPKLKAMINSQYNLIAGVIPIGGLLVNTVGRIHIGGSTHLLTFLQKAGQTGEIALVHAKSHYM